MKAPATSELARYRLPLLSPAHAPASLCSRVFATESQRRALGTILGRYYGVAVTALAALAPLGGLFGGVPAARFDPRAGVAIVGAGFVLEAGAGGLAPGRRPPLPLNAGGVNG